MLVRQRLQRGRASAIVVGAGVAALAAFAACNLVTGAAAVEYEAEGDAAPELSATRDGGHGQTMGSDASVAEPAADARVDAPSFPEPGAFVDDFERTSASTLGNGWIEKTAGVFSLVDGAAQQSDAGGGSYVNWFASRPAAEAARDVTVSVTVSVTDDDSDPCLYARMAPASSRLDELYSYTLYPSGLTKLYLDRDHGGDFANLAGVTISPAMVVGETYVLSLTVTGTTPVSIRGSIATLAGVGLAEIAQTDASPVRIQTPGSVAFGSSKARRARFDDFRRSPVTQ